MRRVVSLFAAAAATLALSASAFSEGSGKAPAPPSGGEMGFLVDHFAFPIVPGMDACPEGISPTLRQAYLASLPVSERDRLSRPDNEVELARNWKALASGPGNTNICTNPEMFNRPLMKTVRHRNAIGMDLDGGGSADGCGHEEFVSPAGEAGIDNQAYRVMGCSAFVRSRDGGPGETLAGLRQFFASGEWTQVVLLKGVDSLQNDPDVTVIYGNTPDRPVQDGTGRFLPGASYTLSDTPPRNRNVLKGRIVSGVLTTDPADIVLTATYGQGGARDIRGNRTKFTFKRGRLRLALRVDGSLEGLVAGYRPIFEEIQSPALGGIGSAVSAGIDCASTLATLRKYADGLKDKATGQCTAVSTAFEIKAIPAFVTDVPQQPGGATP